MYRCDHCEYTTDSETGLKIHTTRTHDNGSAKKEYQCEWCDTTFEDYPSSRESRDRNTFFCSNECQVAHKRRNQTEEDCAWCGEIVRVSPSQQESMGDYSLDHRFCDKNCESEWKRLHWRGEDHPSYDGGHESDYGSNWLAQRRATLERDGYECQLCGMSRDEHYDEYGFDLDVHHRISISAFDVTEDANELSNLVTACRDCHQSTLEADPAPHNDLIDPQHATV